MARVRKPLLPTADEMLELIPEDEFKQLWQVQRNALASDDPHTLMLNRLSHELTSRCGAAPAALQGRSYRLASSWLLLACSLPRLLSPS